MDVTFLCLIAEDFVEMQCCSMLSWFERLFSVREKRICSSKQQEEREKACRQKLFYLPASIR